MPPDPIHPLAHTLQHLLKAQEHLEDAEELFPHSTVSYVLEENRRLIEFVQEIAQKGEKNESTRTKSN